MLNSLQPLELLQPSEIAAILDKLSGATVAVLGDFCLDVYWMLDQSKAEPSVETGLMTESVRVQRYSPGGAGNVVTNLLALGVSEIHLLGVVGNDPFGNELCRLLDHPHVDGSGLIRQSEKWATHTYVKRYVEDKELNRIDFGNFNEISDDTASKFFAALERLLTKVSVVLINHQVTGSMHDSPAFRERLAGLIGNHPEVCFIVDSRGYHEAYGRAVHKLNDREVMRACGVPMEADAVVSLEDLGANIEKLYAHWKAPLVVTRGERGCIVFDGTSPVQIFGIQLPGKTDPVGAGDTFVSCLAAITATGTNLTAAAFVSNIAAAVTAQKLFQTGTASGKEILTLGSTADYVYLPELAESPHRARYPHGGELEVIDEPPSHLNIHHAIFDHDGTISTLREGWEAIMAPMMMKAILGDRLESADETLYNRVKNRCASFIDRTTGIQTIAQMIGLVELVREFAVVPADQVQTPQGYKSVYNEELIKLVNLRLAKYDRGELDLTDFTIKGSVPFLKALRAAGVTLHLASGTDDEDVKNEAAHLGYADLFNGGIHGSLGHVEKDAKKIVLERIMKEIGGAYEQVVTFGDGPVEMRETTRRGGYSIGLASDEVRRFGVNLEKRARLIRAGAHVIIPDFSQKEQLWSFLRLPAVAAGS